MKGVIAVAKVSTNITIDADVKEKAQELFEELGLDLSTAINILFKQSIMGNAIPFDDEREIPNAVTIAAMQETEEMIKSPEKYKRYTDIDEMMRDIFDEV